MQTLTGKLQQLIYESDDGSYAVAIFLADGEEITVVGTLAGANIGENLELTGEYTNHSLYGKQFKISSYAPAKIEDEKAIVEYLSSGVISSIGAKFAEKIVEKFGKNTFHIIEKEPERLLEIEGIGSKKLEKIIKTYNQNIAVRNVIISLSKYGISANLAVKLYNMYKENTLEVLYQNPYVLCKDVRGISFRKADEIAKKLGTDLNSKQRKYQAILFCLEEASYNGHTYIYFKNLATELKNLIGYDDEQELYEIIIDLCGKKLLTVSGDVSELKVYLYYLAQAETQVAARLIKLITGEKKFTTSDKSDEIIKKEVGQSTIEYSEEQISCVYKAVENNVLIITGGPGTGKTTTLFLLLTVFEKLGKKIKLCAPTGKASKRMTETTGKESSTIHRLLEVGFVEDSDTEIFGKNEDEPIDADVIIVDEVSMVDIRLMQSLLDAVKDGTHLVLVGDKDQLPSVGAGNVLKNILDSNIIPYIKLEKIFRQAQKSGIIVNAHRVNNGDYPIVSKEFDDFFIMQRSDMNSARDLVVELASKRLPEYYSITPQEIQVIAPMKKGALGTFELNNLLQDAINPFTPFKGQYKDKYRTFRVGDRIIHIKNNYEKEWQTDDTKGNGIFNGETGTIKLIDKQNSFLTVEFDDGKRSYYDFDELGEIQLAYALTVHKSQGSEYKAVILSILGVAPMLLTRKILYTAMTRAKKLLVIVSDQKNIKKMVDNIYEEKRNTSLEEKLKMFDKFTE